MGTRSCIDELGAYANLAFARLQAALKNVLNAEIATHISYVGGFALVSVGRISGDHK